MLLLDTSVQCSQAANQARVFALGAQARARLNTAYMTCVFLGGSAGSWLGVRAPTRRWGGPGFRGLIPPAGAVALVRPLVLPGRGKGRI